MDKREEILKAKKDIHGHHVNNYIAEDGYVWEMVLQAMQEYSDHQKQKIIDELPKPYDILSKAEELNRIEFKEWWHCLITKIKEL